MRFQVELRVIDDRPDAGGWKSTGRDLPFFNLDATDHDHALSVVNRLVREFGNYTRVNTRVCDVDATAEVQSHMFYAPGWDAERVGNGTHRVAWQWCKDGCEINGSVYAEEDADTATLFYGDGTCAVSVAQTKTGKWRIESSDNGHNIMKSWYDKRFASPREAAGFLAEKWGIAFTEVESFEDDDVNAA